MLLISVTARGYPCTPAAVAPQQSVAAIRSPAARTTDRLAGAATSSDRAPAAPANPLSPRETDVLACVALGCTNADVAEQLGLRPETVKSYLRSAMRKLGAHTRLEVVVAARRAGLLP
ncbi:response regulator transcription factor [Micromonospora sp. RTP1Z1]|uniref:response regulator transcription factor n=1 Tax=Micromonospora sp. RTP1Z1 TaxID=2994043 RepID=UPI0029C91E6B|nr:LuxR C-terminal-related transcriptional regulator [Micromonospora sp. RTP1Z1]